MASTSFTAAAAAAASVTASSLTQQPISTDDVSAAAAAGNRDNEEQHTQIVYVSGNVPPQGERGAVDNQGAENAGRQPAQGEASLVAPTAAADTRQLRYILIGREMFRKFWMRSVVKLWYSPMLLVLALVFDHGRRHLGEGVSYVFCGKV
jgi:alkyl sulfatase BDS1-like metallo-beta-lactamase superfamily hydrolase